MMDSNNQLKSLSKDLLAAARRIMEGKEGTAPKTAKEKELAAHAPPHDKITHADVLVGRGVLKKHPKSGKLVTKEEVEAIDELSKDTMLKYLSANKKSDKAAQDKGDYSKSDKRMRGTDVAVRKYTAGPNSKYVRVAATEEVEHIDELSKKTLGSYVKKASGAEQPKNVMSPKNVPLTKIAAYQGDSETGHFGKRFNQATYDKAERLRKNRETGIKRAIDKLTKEEIEQVDELSKGTLGSYVKKAKDQMSRSDQIAGIELGQRHMGARPGNKERKHNQRASKRYFGIDKAVDKLTKEEVEQVDEISKATMGRYINRAKDSIDVTAYRQGAKGSTTGPLEKKLSKRHKGIETAVKKLTAEDTGMSIASAVLAKMRAKNEAVDLDEAMNATDRFHQHHSTAKDLLKSISQHLSAHADSAKNAKDYKGKKGPNWGHVGSMENIANQLGSIHDQLARHGEYADTMRESVELDEAPVDGVAAGSLPNDGHLCATKVMHKEWAEGTPLYSQHAEPDADGNIAWYDVMFEHGIEKGVSIDDLDILMSESHERHGKRKMKEEAELDEARGRPRKNPLPKGEEEEPEPRQHIIQQLQRAKLSMQGSAKVKFKDGTTHDIHGGHAAKLLDKYAGMKPFEKEVFQKKIGGSHQGLKSEL